MFDDTRRPTHLSINLFNNYIRVVAPGKAHHCATDLTLFHVISRLRRDYDSITLLLPPPIHISTRLYLPKLYICDTRQPADCFRFWFSSIHDRRASLEIPFQTTRFFLLEIYYCRTYYYNTKLLLLSLPTYVYTYIRAW